MSITEENGIKINNYLKNKKIDVALLYSFKLDEDESNIEVTNAFIKITKEVPNTCIMNVVKRTLDFITQEEIKDAEETIDINDYEQTKGYLNARINVDNDILIKLLRNKKKKNS